MNKKNRILIIGAGGMLGQRLVKIYQADPNYVTIGWDRAEIDVTNESAMRTIIPDQRPDVIINATGYNAVDLAETDDQAYAQAVQINGVAPGILADIARETGAIFVHYSSDYVFDGERETYIESDQPRPISRYGQTKLLGEQTIQERGEKFYLIRTSKLFGPPASAPGAKKSFFETMLTMAKSDENISVIDGEQSCFTYAPDLAEATKILIEEQYPFGIYHIVNEGLVTWYEGSRALFRIAGISENKLKPISVNKFDRPAKRPDSSALVNSKFPLLRNYKDAIKEWLNGLSK